MSDRDEPSPEVIAEATPDEIEQVSAALRAIAPRDAEPDWATLSADIGAAVDGETHRQRRARVIWIGGAVFAAAAVAALLVWPVARGRDDATPQAGATADAAPADDNATDELATDEAPGSLDELDLDDELAAALALPDDLGGITLDEELVDEAAAALDQDLGDAEDALDDRLLPDGAWIDELSDDDLERAALILDQEAS